MIYDGWLLCTLPSREIWKLCAVQKVLALSAGDLRGSRCHREVLADVAWVLPAASRADRAVALPCRHSEPHQPGGSAVPDLHGWTLCKQYRDLKLHAQLCCR